MLQPGLLSHASTANLVHGWEPASTSDMRGEQGPRSRGRDRHQAGESSRRPGPWAVHLAGLVRKLVSFPLTCPEPSLSCFQAPTACHSSVTHISRGPAPRPLARIPMLCGACQLPLHGCPDMQAAVGCPSPAVKHPRASLATPPSYTCTSWLLASCWPYAYSSRSGCGVQA